ncbi:MAG: BlaB/IND/MUS family subclass B1 metallo-beta-lactamase [Pyrinomonadaceae bacterium]|uniref:subclass B1 metallo-beta-lactamase CAM-2 n=1 Tax=Pyrinomonadaceae bacterium TaxID=2283092 RepID=UPI00296A9BA9|nr:subclass B1 metallo-beta-lactamase CAM-2 [Pyrinomonadaceae bacterium]MCD9185600.1 BlaB/IND/MUS family subclass B1 metallo-beta-lactamase [Pyrinomonadaceae bacterium]
MKLTAIILFLLAFSPGVFGQMSDALKITPLVGDFYIFTTYQTYKDAKVPANGMYVVTAEGVVLIDTPWDETQLQPLLNYIKEKHNKDVVMSVSTHFHEDRTNGIEFLKTKGVKTYTTRKTDELSQKKGYERAEFLLEKDTEFKLGQYKFQTFYPGEGHAPDNIVVWFPNEKILYGGCFIKSTEADDIGNLSDANINEWSNSIMKVQKKFKNPKFVIPGHDGWASTKSLKHTLKLIREFRGKTAQKK